MRDERRFSPALKDEFDFEFLEEEEGESDYWDQDETKNNDIDDDDSNTYYKKRMRKFRDAFIDAFDDDDDFQG